MTVAAWLNLAWMTGGWPRLQAFHQATRRVAEVQQQELLRILRWNRHTSFGRRHHFDRLRGPADFQRAVPLATYDDLLPDILRIGHGQRDVLTRDPVGLLEPTSGTTRGEKWIPYTRSLRRQFQRAVTAWTTDLLWHRPALRRGRAYWSVSPALGPPRRSPGGIPIGFDDDAAYLASYEQWLVRRLLVAPPGVRRLSDLDNFRYATLLSLLRADDLTLISIWNPTFLTALLERLPAWSERLIRDLADGRFRPPVPLAPRLAASTVPGVPGQPRRAELLGSLLSHQPADSLTYDCLWPRLQLISCWTDAAARLPAGQLARLFPAVEIQGKGLLATECCVSFPLTAPAAPVLALQSAFFEFLPCNTDGQAASDADCRLAGQLETAGHYQVIVTTGGGLYRYQLHDQVQVLGHYRDCPLLRFVGKTDCTSDLVGEKLSEPQVRQAMEEVAERLGLRLEFALLVPVCEPRDHYRLYLQTAGEPLGACQARRLAAELQARLEDNPHYRYACGLQQLDPLEVWWLAHSERSARDQYLRGCLARGQRLGDIKPLALDTRTGWPDILADCGDWRRAGSREA